MFLAVLIAEVGSCVSQQASFELGHSICYSLSIGGSHLSTQHNTTVVCCRAIRPCSREGASEDRKGGEDGHTLPLTSSSGLSKEREKNQSLSASPPKPIMQQLSSASLFRHAANRPASCCLMALARLGVRCCGHFPRTPKLS